MRVRLANKARQERRMLPGVTLAHTQSTQTGGQSMKNVWLARVSVGVIAAWMAGCGGGSGGDAPGATSLISNSPPVIRNVIDSPVLVPLVEFFRYASGDPGGMDYETPTLISNGKGDLLLVWDNRIDGMVRSMFYHPLVGWSAPEIVVLKPVAANPFGEFRVWLDAQGNAVILEDAPNSIGNFYIYTNGAWKVADQLKDEVDISRPILEKVSIMPDNSELGVLYLVSYPPSVGLIVDMSRPKVLRLKSDGRWEGLAQTPVLAVAEPPLADCFLACITGVEAAENERGDLLLAFTARKNGVRSVKYSVESGWSEVAILDSNSSLIPPPSVVAVAIDSNQRAAVLWKVGVWRVGTTYNLKLAIENESKQFDLNDVDSTGLHSLRSSNRMHLDHQTISVTDSRTDLNYNGIQPPARIGINHVLGENWDTGAIVKFERSSKVLFNASLSESEIVEHGWTADGFMFSWLGQGTFETQQFRRTGWTSVKVYPLTKSNITDFTTTNIRFAISGTNWVAVIRGRDGLHSVQWPIQ